VTRACALQGRPAIRPAAERLGQAGLAAIAVSIVATIAVGAAGPSLMEPPLPGAAAQPPWTLDMHPGPYLAVGLAAAGLAAGTLGLALTLRAMRLGWTIRARYVLLAGVIAAVVAGTTAPFGTSDFLSYAAYGRELVTGHNPYLVTPQTLARLGDPVGRAVQDWAGTPSVYGALGTGVFGLASLIGGASARLTVFVLDIVNVLAFVGTGVLLDRLARGPAGRLRAAVLWTCNPLLLQILVAGGHVDGLAAAFSIAGIAVLAPLIPNGARSSRLLPRALAGGVILGLGFAVKPTVLLVFAGLVIALIVARLTPYGVDAPRSPQAPHAPHAPRAFLPPRAPRASLPPHPAALAPISRLTLGALVGGFCAVAVADLALMGRAGIAESFRASGMVSVGSPWRVVRTLLRVSMLSESGADDVVRGLALVLMVCLAAGLLWWLRRPGGVFDAAPLRTAGVLAGAAPFALVLAWLLTWPYVLPWYDALGWALLPLLPASGIDLLLLARTAALGFGYLPARVAGITIPAGLRWMEPVIRSALTPAVLAGVVVILLSMMRSPVRSVRQTSLAGADKM